MTLAIRSDRAPLSARQMRLSHGCWRSKLQSALAAYLLNCASRMFRLLIKCASSAAWHSCTSRAELTSTNCTIDGACIVICPLYVSRIPRTDEIRLNTSVRIICHVSGVQ